MELFAAIRALEALKEPCRVTLHSDSEYLVNAMKQGWARRWRARNWRRGKNEPVANPDLWSRLLDLCGKHEVEFAWLRGHDGNAENERCDELCAEARAMPDPPVDEGYTSAIEEARLELS